MELQARYGEFQKLGLGIASVTYDAPATIKKFADERKIEFPILWDEDHSIVERYGILNRQYALGHQNYGIPHPGTFIVNREGRVLARYFEEEFQYRNTAASIALKIGQPVSRMGAPSVAPYERARGPASLRQSIDPRGIVQAAVEAPKPAPADQTLNRLVHGIPAAEVEEIGRCPHLSLGRGGDPVGDQLLELKGGPSRLRQASARLAPEDRRGDAVPPPPPTHAGNSRSDSLH